MLLRCSLNFGMLSSYKCSVPFSRFSHHLLYNGSVQSFKLCCHSLLSLYCYENICNSAVYGHSLMAVLNRGEQQARKSTQRRQKQYFEQKKRRQQQQAAVLNEVGDGMDRYGQRQKEHHRSLDILSFLNFSTIAQQHRSGTDYLKAIDSKIETKNAHDLSVAIMDVNTLVCPTELKREVPASTHNAEAASSEKFVNKVCLKAPVEEMYQWEIFPEANMSILDFLGDDGTDQSTEVKPANEDHVAFSVDGLGRVGTETPVNSPQHRSRTFSYGAFSSSKDPRDFDLFVDPINASCEFDPRCKADSSIPDVNAACSPSPGSFSQHIWDPFSIPECEALRFFSSLKHNLDESRQKLSSACCTDNSSKYTWNDQDVASPPWHVSSDDGHLYGKSYEVTSMDCPFRWDGRSDDYTSASCQNQGSFDHASDSVYLQKKRYSFKAKRDSSILGIPAQNFSAEIDCSYMVMEDPNDRLSSKRFEENQK